MLIKKTQLNNFQEANFYILEASQYCQIYSDFLFGTGLFQVYLNNVINTTLGGGTDLGGHPGQLILTTGTNASGEGRIGNSSVQTLKLGTGVIKFETCVQLPVLSTSAQEYEVNIGFINSTKAVLYGCYFFYDPVGNSSNWQCICCYNGNKTVIDTGVAVTANAWYKLTIVVLQTSKALFFLNNTFIGSITTNIPDNSIVLNPMVGIAKWAGTTARIMNVDYVDFIYKLIR